MSGQHKIKTKRVKPAPQYRTEQAAANEHGSTSYLPQARWRLTAFLVTALATTLCGAIMMYDILSANGLTWFETTLLFLFVVTFGWISVAFWSGLIGFVLRWLRRDPMTLTRQHGLRQADCLGEFKTAVVMPVYNEDVTRVVAGFEACMRSLQATGQAQHFDFYLLSDSQNEAIKAAELRAWRHLEQRSQDFAGDIYYRNRQDNRHRKVGNITDFCERWGWRYEAMIVLDADSVMTGECMVDLARGMKANPQVGLVQTVPIPMRQTTFFGRFLQFAASLCSPMLATGLAFWQTDNANYWGHNAIIRIQAFVSSCGLPVLSGRAPFGGEILSHDFVEAALLRRDGWQVVLDANQQGSYEEVPGNIIDYATRDRRWLQGNIQHLAMLGMNRLTFLSRLHMFLGAMAYLTSALWFLMLLLSSLDAVTRALVPNEFFSSGYQLFPSWPIAKTGVIAALLTMTASLLLLPKVFAIALAWRDQARAYGGALRLVWSSCIELCFAVFIAPVMMVFHTSFVFSTLSGVDIAWNAQPREGRILTWRESFSRTWLASLLALLWAGTTAYFTATYFYWLLPVVIGLVFAAPILRWSSSSALGAWFARRRWLLSPCESQPPAELLDLEAGMARVSLDVTTAVAGESSAPRMPPDVYLPMPSQPLFKGRNSRPVYSPTGTQIVVDS